MASAKDSSGQPSFRPLASPDRLWGPTAKTVDMLHANPRRVAADMLRLFIATRIPVTLWGPVGARKTRTIEAFAAQRDENGTPYQVITLQPSTQDPTIIHGMMYTAVEGSTTVMRRSIPAVAEQVMKHAEENNGLTILFADEMTTCMPSQQNAMLGLLTHGRFEQIDISPHIAIVMAANPEGTVSSVIPLNEAVLNRGGHLAWYGDRELFIEEWSTGFGGSTPAPKPETVQFVTSMFDQIPNMVFRSKQWSPQTLVPWDSLEHTERAVTEMARLHEFIGEQMRECPSWVREFYIIEATRALLGPEWANAARSVFDQRADVASRQHVIEWLRRATPQSVEACTSVDDLVAKHGSPWDETLRHDQSAAIMKDLVAAAGGGKRDDNFFSHENYLAAWCFASVAPSEADGAALDEHLGSLALLAQRAVSEGLLSKDGAVPAFVPREVRARAKSAAEAASAS